MKIGEAALMAVAALSLAACANQASLPPPPPIPVAPPPPPPPPSATIIGHGAYQTRAGARGDCTGLSIALMHDTPAFHARLLTLYGSDVSARVSIATIKARSAKLGPFANAPLAESVTCEPGGDFAFRDVAAGPYFLIARVKVTLPSGAPEDLVVLRHLDIVAGETRDISLAP